MTPRPLAQRLAYLRRRRAYYLGILDSLSGPRRYSDLANECRRMVDETEEKI